MWHGQGRQVEMGRLARVIVVRDVRSTGSLLFLPSSCRGSDIKRPEGQREIQMQNGADQSFTQDNLPPLVLPPPNEEPAPKPVLWLLEPNPPPPNPKDMMSAGVEDSMGA